LNPQDKPQPKVPNKPGTGATMGHEDEAGLDSSELEYTGGLDGQGSEEPKTASTKQKVFGDSDMINKLKEAQLKKLEPKKPMADDEDIQPVGDKAGKGKKESLIGKEEIVETDTFDDYESSGGHIGHEKETLGDKPSSPKDHP